VILIASAGVFLLGRRKYKIVEKALVFLVCFMSLSFMMTMILIEPDFSSVLNGFLPTLPANSLYLALALVGTTVVPYNLFLHSSAVKQKWREKSDLGTLNKDLLLSVTLGGFISASIVVTSAVAFHQQGMEVLTGAHLARQLEPLFGSAAKILFGFGFFAAGLSSAITAPYAAAFACSGVLGWKGGQDDKGFRAVWLTVILAGLAVSLLDLKPLSVIVFAQVANGLVLPVASVFLLVVLNDRKRMGSLANNPRQNILGAIIILIVAFLGIWNIIKIFVK
jgi:Mn2+/Fe2+ NRAMP family transporter